ncbi:hypothetical protein FQN60_009327 [Etheostoma spectabile]|uniref:PH domain-containing protein n=1 Tax=Etheostoma spectabile TaxID=54343 RepID=A0A5J5DIT0_9PERO|nr:hypothetical protein FQN60_009327 [Etheostoma spectabile]
MQSEGERRGQWCVSVPLLSTSLFISPSLLHLSVRRSRLLHCRYMTDPGEDVEVPCGQESQVGGGKNAEVTHRDGVRTRRGRRGKEEGRLMEEWTARSLEKQYCHRRQHDPSRPAGPAVSPIQLEEPATIHSYLQHCDLDMNGKVNTNAEKITHSKSANMVSDLSPEGQPYTRRSNSMRRNPKAAVSKQGWLYKQASSGVKQWNKRWFVLADRCLFYYKDEKEDTVLGSLPLLSFRIGGVEPSDNITRKFAFKILTAGAAPDRAVCQS